MKISVLIPTLGRKRELIETVLWLTKQSRVPDEIIVVDQNQPSIPEVDRLLQTIPYAKHIRTDQPGVTRNYNLALQSASGDVVLYVDDDVVPDAALVANHLRHYERDSSIAGVAGRVESAHGDRDPESIASIGRYNRWTGSLTTHFNGLDACEVQFAQGANMSFRRESLLAIGGFDMGFDGNGYFFETDACLRIVESGKRIVFDPEASLKHLMAPSGGARMKNKSAHTYYFVKNGILLSRRHSPELARPLCTLRLAGYALAKSAYNRDPRILARTIEAVRDGWKKKK